MSGLSDQQQAVVDFIRNGRGSLNLVARAGCGKTHTVVHGICKTIYDEQPRAEVAAMAYNKAAGNEIKGRLTSIGLTDWRRLQAGTVHSFGFAAWRKAAPNVRIDGDKVSKIINGISGSKEDHPFYICRQAIRKTVSLAKQCAFSFLVPAGDDGAWYELIDHHGLDDDLTEDFDVNQLIDMAQQVLRISLGMDYETIDFDDMILAPLTHKARFWGKDYVIIDEAQDTNAARRALALAMLKPKTGRLIAVGDDRQAIYGFTGADSDAMEIIRKQMNSAVLPLNVTYRCPQAVVAEARLLVKDFTAHESAPEGVVRSLDYTVDDKDQGNIRYWFESEDLRAGDAILCRNTKPLVEEAYSLIRAGIGCIVEGREIGKGLVQLATRWTRIKTLPTLSGKLEEYREREVTKWLAKGREEKADAVEDRVATLQTIISRVIEKGGETIFDLRDAIESLFGDSDEKTPSQVVRLATVHKAKGREWDRVYALGRRAYMPSKYARKAWQLRQEENLEYVMVTRAKSEFIDVVLA